MHARGPSYGALPDPQVDEGPNARHRVQLFGLLYVNGCLVLIFDFSYRRQPLLLRKWRFGREFLRVRRCTSRIDYW